MKASLLYYSNDRLPEQLRNQCLANIVAIKEFEELIVVVPPGRGYDFAEVIGKCAASMEVNIEARILEPEPGRAGHHDITVKTLAGLKACRSELVFLVEHDVLYPDDYLAMSGGCNKGPHVWYNMNTYSANSEGYLIGSCRPLTSNAFSRVEVFTDIFNRRLEAINTAQANNQSSPIRRGEPARNPGDGPYTPITVSAPSPTVDVRWGGNLTGNRAGATIQDLKYWGNHAALWAALKLKDETL